MALSDEEYKRLDAEYAAKREHFDSRVKHYSLLEDVINGKATFENRALELSREFRKLLPKIPGNLLNGQDYMKKLMSFIGMIENLYPARIPISEQAFRDYLTGKRRMRKEDWPGTNEVFDHLGAVSKMLDRKVRKLYAPTLFQENPRLFREVYADMSLEERAYTEHRLYKMLGAGIFSRLGIDEITLQRFLHEPLLQSQFDTYIDNVIASVTGNKVKNPVTMRYHGPNEGFMRTIEERLEPPIGENEKAEFRRSLFWKSLWEKGKVFDYTSNERLCRAVEKKIEDIPGLRKKR